MHTSEIGEITTYHSPQYHCEKLKIDKVLVSLIYILRFDILLLTLVIESTAGKFLYFTLVFL